MHTTQTDVRFHEAEHEYYAREDCKYEWNELNHKQTVEFMRVKIVNVNEHKHRRTWMRFELDSLPREA